MHLDDNLLVGVLALDLIMCPRAPLMRIIILHERAIYKFGIFSIKFSFQSLLSNLFPFLFVDK